MDLLLIWDAVFGWIWISPPDNPTGPATIVSQRRGHGMTAIDKDHAQRRRPVGRNGIGPTDDRDHTILQPGPEKRATEFPQGFHGAEFCIEQLGVMVLLPGLMLFGTAMVIERIKHRSGLTHGWSQIQRRLAAIRANLENRAQTPRRARQLGKFVAFLGRKETFYIIR